MLALDGVNRQAGDELRSRLPCSFNTYVILGAYVIQSEAGDWDPKTHEGIEYLFNVPFAPKNLQTPEMLVRIAELHQTLKIKQEKITPLEFTIPGYTWARIVELSYKGKEFVMVVRPVVFDEYIESPGDTKGPRRRTSTSSSRAGSPSGRGNTKQRSRSAKPSLTPRHKTLTFKCLNAELAKRLYNVVVDHHAFFRLRANGEPRRYNLQPGFSTRKYHYNSRPQIFDDNESTVWTLNKDGGLPPTNSIRRVAAQRKPDQYAKSLVTLMTPVAPRKENHFRAPCASIEDEEGIKNEFQSPVNTIGPHESSVLMEESYAPVKSAPKVPTGWTPLVERQVQQVHLMAPPPVVSPKHPRPQLSKEHWQMSPADCTQGLGMDLHGTDVATMMDAGWQGSRTNRGVKGPGSYYYEVIVLEDGDVRVGWSVNDASLLLGMDDRGYGYGAAENGKKNIKIYCDGSLVKQSTMGRLVHNGKAYEMGFPIHVSDVLGCFLQLQEDADGGGLVGNVMWSHNGQLVTSPHANLVRIPPEIANENAFFPTVSLRDARVALNFGEIPFVHSPEQISGGRVQWTAPVHAPLERTVHNVNAGWRINQFDTTSTLNLVVSEDGRMIQTKDTNEWQGFRANRGVFEAGKYYYETEIVEDSGFARFGWSLPGGNLQLGADNLGYGFGHAPDGSPAKKVFNGEVENYGTRIRVGDVVGCFLDLDNGFIQWSVNGEMLPPAYYMDSSFISHPKTIFFPSASLFCTTLEVNYGDRPFKYQPSEEWYPLFAAADQYVQDSLKWPRGLNGVLQLHATTERVESDIHLAEVTITVNEKDPVVLSHQPPAGSHEEAMGDHEDEEEEEEEDEEEDTVICAASDAETAASRDHANDGRRRRPRKTSAETRLDSTKVQTEEGDPEVTVEYYTNEEGQRVKRIIQKHRKVITTIRNESVERFETTRVFTSSSQDGSNQPSPSEGSNVNEDEALNKAIHETTKLDSDTFVVNGSSDIRSDSAPTIPVVDANRTA
ncbi:unnamed protein product [Mesocestoides corti]|uniref:B30.2/SPRY domain-containing protein n=1 Tax=Mesocestoides corti TaxID=53468 RepID=A0A0R3U4P0_MESCO|nr:unnamed protein product [Mesocestoides corti]